jgi:hypothetical protein
MKKTLTALTLAIGAIGSSQAAPVQWTVGSGGNGHWYEFFATAVDWNTARADALSRGGYLATITSAAENSFAAVSAAGGALAWIGGTDAAVEGEWKWADGPEAGVQFWQGGPSGTALGYTNWNGGEPNNCCGGENYLQLNWATTGGWNDHGGPGNASQLNGYLVEYNVPEPMTLAMVMSGLLAAVLTRRRRA